MSLTRRILSEPSKVLRSVDSVVALCRSRAYAPMRREAPRWQILQREVNEVSPALLYLTFVRHVLPSATFCFKTA